MYHEFEGPEPIPYDTEGMRCMWYTEGLLSLNFLRHRQRKQLQGMTFLVKHPSLLSFEQVEKLLAAYDEVCHDRYV